jgi:hypothetical protein
MLHNVLKILVFIVLAGGFVWFDSYLRHGHEIQANPLVEGRAIAMFVVGAAIAVWGNKEIGVIDPISLRSIFIILGALLMIFSGVLIYALREPSA